MGIYINFIYGIIVQKGGRLGIYKLPIGLLYKKLGVGIYKVPIMGLVYKKVGLGISKVTMGLLYKNFSRHKTPGARFYTSTRFKTMSESQNLLKMF